MPVKDGKFPVLLYAYSRYDEEYKPTAIIKDSCTVEIPSAEWIFEEDGKFHNAKDTSFSMTFKVSLISRIKIRWLLRRRKKIDIFGRLWDAIKVTFEGLSYQIKHSKQSKK